MAPAAGKKQYPGPNLELAEDVNGNVNVKGLTQHAVSTLEEAVALIHSGLALRQTASTSSNDVSSRSHTIFSLTVSRGSDDGREGRLDLVDLAGSERLKKSESEGERAREAKHINTSLTALGKVVLALSSMHENIGGGGGGGGGGGNDTGGGAAAHIPYRDSKLTRLLKNTLSGNSHTVLLCAVNPSGEHHDETINSLQFAHRCCHVQTQPKVGGWGVLVSKQVDSSHRLTP